MSRHDDLLALLGSVKTRDEAALASIRAELRAVEARIETLRQSRSAAILSGGLDSQAERYCQWIDQSIRRENMALARAMVDAAEAESALRKSLGRFTALREVLKTMA